MTLSNATMTTETNPPRGWALVILGVGLAVGFLMYGLEEARWLQAWDFGVGQGVLMAGLAFALAGARGRWQFSSVFALVLGAINALLIVTAMLRYGQPDPYGRDVLTLSMYIESLLFSLIALTFFQAWQSGRKTAATPNGDTEGWHGITYARLFGHFWETILVVLVSLCFLGLFWSVLWLFALLFHEVGVEALEILIAEPLFEWPASCGAFALSIFFTRQHERIIAALRSIVFALFAILTPVFLVLAVSFVVVLISGGLARMEGLVSASATLIVLAGFGILFVNAVVRDGASEDEQPTVVRVSALLLLPCLLLFCGFAAYAIGLRIGQYGLTPERIFVAVATALLTLASLAYLASLLARESWMVYCRRINIALILVLAAATVALMSPLADPYRLSAESQYKRLASGGADPAKFEYGFLKFELGNAGQDVLARMAEDSGIADPAVVAERLAALALVDDEWEWRSANRAENQTQQVQAILADRQRVQRVPADLDVPADIGPDWIHYQAKQCGDAGCILTSLDLTDQPGPEFLFATRTDDGTLTLHLLERKSAENGWNATWLAVNSEAGAFWSALQNGDLQAITPAHRDLKIGDEVLRLRPTPSGS
ncbi:DUF4153 domain-containing protein [Pelagibius sp.]|uniref:DUF4153 domain-containing protein n=2 Tax=Pelagibius sp. TaxID=1931238 RepID=UPI003BAF4548